MLAFESVLDLEVTLSIDVNATKFVNLTIGSIALNGFNVTTDNLGGSVKSDEKNILYRLQGVIAVVQVAIQSVMSALHIRLPEFQLIDYSIKFDYQDGALGTGIMLTRK